jgi:polyphenol oxidase
MSFELCTVDQWTFFHYPDLSMAHVAHGFFTKASPHHLFPEGDKTTFLRAFSLRDIIVMEQEHGDTVHLIEKGERPVSGDGLILIESGVAAIVKTADCLPIILCAPRHSVAAIIHAGWRGTARRIAQKTMQRLFELGVPPDSITALIGPSIGSCCYEVHSDVYDVFMSEGFPRDIFHRQDRSLRLDLRAANIGMVRQAGIEQVLDLALCTHCRRDLFASHRRGDKDQRQVNFVSLPV